HLQRLLPGQGVGTGGGLTGGVELVDSGANRLAHPHCSHPSSVVVSVVGTSDFRGTHSALLLLAKSLSLTLSHAPADGRQARRIPAVANPPTGGRALFTGCSGSGSIREVLSRTARVSARSSSVASGLPGHTCLPMPSTRLYAALVSGSNCSESPKMRGSRLAADQLRMTRSPARSVRSPTVTVSVTMRRLDTKGSSMRRISSRIASNSRVETPERSRS